jgi:hypothetical protein
MDVPGGVGASDELLASNQELLFDVRDAKVNQYVGNLAELVLQLGNGHGGTVKVRYLANAKHQTCRNNFVEQTIVQLDALLATTLPTCSDSSTQSWFRLESSLLELSLFVPPFRFGTAPRHFHSGWARQERQTVLMTSSELLGWRPSLRLNAPPSPLLQQGDAHVPWHDGQSVMLAESTQIELKREVSGTLGSRLPEYVCGFRNGVGGCLCIGVDDTRVEGRVTLVGVDAAAIDTFEHMLCDRR